MQFDYEISAEDYVSGRVLNWRLQWGRKYIWTAIFMMLMGLCFVVIALSERLNWAPIVAASFGVAFIYYGARNLFPARHLRRLYQKSGLAGQPFHAAINEKGFEVIEELCSWRVKWPGVTSKGENDRVFVFCSAGTAFIFGKKYLTDEQQL